MPKPTRRYGLPRAASAIRDMEHMGGLDKYILNQDDAGLSKRALAVRARIRNKMKSGAKAGAKTGTKTTAKGATK